MSLCPPLLVRSPRSPAARRPAPSAAGAIVFIALFGLWGCGSSSSNESFPPDDAGPSDLGTNAPRQDVSTGPSGDAPPPSDGATIGDATTRCQRSSVVAFLSLVGEACATCAESTCSAEVDQCASGSCSLGTCSSLDRCVASRCPSCVPDVRGVVDARRSEISVVFDAIGTDGATLGEQCTKLVTCCATLQTLLPMAGPPCVAAVAQTEGDEARCGRALDAVRGDAGTASALARALCPE